MPRDFKIHLHVFPSSRELLSPVKLEMDEGSNCDAMSVRNAVVDFDIDFGEIETDF